MKKNGFALRAFINGDSVVDKDQVLPDMPTNQFNDWSAPGVDLIREATADEVAKAKSAETPSVRAKSKPDA